MRFMVMHKQMEEIDESAPLPPPSEREQQELSALMDEWKKAGVLQAAEAVLPSAQAVRLQFKGLKRTVIDGPFAESKELIGGFSILELPSREEAIAWTNRYAAILGDVEVDVLRLSAPW